MMAESDTDSEHGRNVPGPSTKKKFQTKIVHKKCRRTYSRATDDESRRTIEKRAKSAEATGRWRKKNKGVTESSKKQPKTAAQRMREYRERKRKAKKILLKQQSVQDLDATVSTTSSNGNERGSLLQIIADIVFEHGNNEIEVDDEHTSIEQVQKPRLNKAPKTSAERGRDFRERKALLKQQNKLQQKPNLVVKIGTENIQSAGLSEDNQVPRPSEIRTMEKRAKSAEATRRWRKKKKGVTESSKKQPKTAAQRMREYRERKKLAKKILLKQQSVQDLDATVSTTSSHANERSVHLTTNSISAEPTRRGNPQTQGLIETSGPTRDYYERRNDDVDIESRSSPYSSYAPTMLEMDMNESSNSESVDVKPFIHSPWFALSSSHSRQTEPRAPSVQNEESSTSFAFDENSSYFQFFRGIHNDYLELSAKKQRLFKRKCLSLLHELLDDEESQPTTTYTNDSGQYDDAKEQKPHIEENFILPNN